MDDRHHIRQTVLHEADGLPADGRPPENAWLTFAKGLVRFDRRQAAPWLGVRSATAVALLLSAGLCLDAMPQALVATIGALNVAMSDSHEPYRHRVPRLLVASLLGGLAVFSGSTSALASLLAVPVLCFWAFASGLSVAVSTAVANLGRVSLATLIVFTAYPLPVGHAAHLAGLAVGGGLLLTALASVSWPLRRFVAERRALHSLYKQLASLAAVGAPAGIGPAAANELAAAHRALAEIYFSRSMEGQRLHALLSQAERLRVDLLALHRLYRRLAKIPTADPHAESIRISLQLSAQVLLGIARSLVENEPLVGTTSAMAQLQAHIASLTVSTDSDDSETEAMLVNTRELLEASLAHLRTTVDIATNATPSGLAKSLAREARKPWNLRISGGLATLRANLSLRSAAFRHAIRLAGGVALVAVLSFLLDLPRPHWAVMATALVLMPDFAATFSRGVLRLAGTLVGLVLATALLATLPVSAYAQVSMVVVLTLVLRYVASANHGLYVMVGTALIVALLTQFGIDADDVVVVRGANTVIGGSLALLVYWLWPTWERTQTGDVLAAMLDAYRRYFRAVWTGYVRPELSIVAELDRARQVARRTRSNVDASLERLRAEPSSGTTMKWLDAALPASHRFIHASLALEAVLSTTARIPASDAHIGFARAVELTLYQLTDALRGLPIRRIDLPDLRYSQSQLLKSRDSLIERDALVNVEVERLTSSLELLSAHILGYVASLRHKKIAPSSPRADSSAADCGLRAPAGPAEHSTPTRSLVPMAHHSLSNSQKGREVQYHAQAQQRSRRL